MVAPLTLSLIIVLLFGCCCDEQFSDLLRSSVLECLHHLDTCLNLGERHIDRRVEADRNLAVLVRFNALGVVDDALDDAVIVDDGVVDEHSAGLVQLVDSEHERPAASALQDDAVLPVVRRHVEFLRHCVDNLSDVLCLLCLFLCDSLHVMAPFCPCGPCALVFVLCFCLLVSFDDTTITCYAIIENR